MDRVRPYFGERAIATTKISGLPNNPAKLDTLAPRTHACLAANLVRSTLDHDVTQHVAG